MQGTTRQHGGRGNSDASWTEAALPKITGIFFLFLTLLSQAAERERERTQLTHFSGMREDNERRSKHKPTAALFDFAEISRPSRNIRGFISAS